MKKIILACSLAIGIIGCASVQPPQWNPITKKSEAEYKQYIKKGTGVIVGQAFLTQKGGGVVKAAGRNITLDPATSTGNEWWAKAGKVWEFRNLTPASPNFHKTHKVVVADADGRFKFEDVPFGKYFIRTEVTWDVPYYGAQGGILGKQIEVITGETTEVILNQYAK